MSHLVAYQYQPVNGGQDELAALHGRSCGPGLKSTASGRNGSLDIVGVSSRDGVDQLFCGGVHNVNSVPRTRVRLIVNPVGLH
jgi:hypothetical protein